MTGTQIYTLMHMDTPLLKFAADPNAANADYDILWANENKRQLLPFGLETSAKGLETWIKRRNIPKNRAFANTFLARNGLSDNRALGIITLSKGLSLDDCYWVIQEGDSSTFDQVNLYDNPISRLLAQVAFTGAGSPSKAKFHSSPEFTTGGMLPKCWRRIDGKIYLYKGGSTGFANAGFEPYTEYYAADVAKVLDFDAIDYSLHRWKDTLCSSCELFTSKDYSFVPAADVVGTGGWSAVRSEYAAMGAKFDQALSDMLAFDALICNTDRHLGNFGFLAKNSTNKICAPAPLFDHGNSLFYQAYGDDWSSTNALSAYAASQKPCLYDDFFENAREVMTRTTKAKVKKALGFKFTRRPARNFPAKRLSMTEEQIRLRAKQLLGCADFCGLSHSDLFRESVPERCEYSADIEAYKQALEEDDGIRYSTDEVMKMALAGQPRQAQEFSGRLRVTESEASLSESFEASRK